MKDSSIGQELREYIEELIILRKLCQLRFRSHTGTAVTIETRLTDLYSDEETEYLGISGNFRVSLSQVIDIDGKCLGGTC